MYDNITDGMQPDSIHAAIKWNNAKAGYKFYSASNQEAWQTQHVYESFRQTPSLVYYVTKERGHFMNVRWVYAIRVYDRASHSVSTAEINGQSCAPYLTLADAYQDLDKLCPKS